MRLSIALSVLSVATLGLAQNTTSSAPPPQNTTTPQNTILAVQVGGSVSDSSGIYQFIPNILTNVTDGTIITFTFTAGMIGNHSVAQSTFDNPCNPFDQGFDSGWVNVADSVTTLPQWNITITNASAPIWFFCKQLLPAPHCHSGMVGAINPPDSGDQTFNAFLSNAEQQSTSGQEEGTLVGIDASASAGPGPSIDGVSFFTATVPASAPSGPASPPAPANGALTITANLLMVTLGVMLSGSFCLV